MIKGIKQQRSCATGQVNQSAIFDTKDYVRKKPETALFQAISGFLIRFDVVFSPSKVN